MIKKLDSFWSEIVVEKFKALFRDVLKSKFKEKTCPVHAVTLYRMPRGKALPISDLGTRWK
jgi:DNA/RNA-binding domain of Phe-tRNA-synthetase-like protein